MTAETNCLTHDSPHQRAGRCAVFSAALDEAYEQARAQQGDQDAWSSMGAWVNYMPADLGDCTWRTDRWAEPHEGITGRVRQDDLLELTDEALARRKIMIVMAKALHDALLVGNPAPRVARMYERFGADKAQPGDLVIEQTTLHVGDARGFGILIERREEWACTLAAWETVIEEERQAHAAAGYSEPFDPASIGPRQTDHAWYVQYGPEPESVCRWTNCSFVAVPTTDDQLREQPVGTRDGNGVTLNRDDLVGALSDAGFQLRQSPEERPDA